MNRNSKCDLVNNELTGKSEALQLELHQAVK
jgi:hypothetical protein